MTFDKNAFKEAVSEPLRLLVLAVLPFVIAYFTKFDYTWAMVATAVLRAVDRYLHVAGSNKAGKKGEGKSFGLVRV